MLSFVKKHAMIVTDLWILYIILIYKSYKQFEDNNSLQRTEIGVVSLVEEDLLAHFLHHDVPGIHRPTAAHERCNDGVGGEHVALRLGDLGERKIKLT